MFNPTQPQLNDNNEFCRKKYFPYQKLDKSIFETISIIKRTAIKGFVFVAEMHLTLARTEEVFAAAVVVAAVVVVARN